MTADYLIRFVQVHETFRKPEIEALATLANVAVDIVHYEDNSPFCIVRLSSEDAASAFIRRSILSYGIYELWGRGTDYASLHESVAGNPASRRPEYKHASFRFTTDAFQGKRSPAAQKELIESFSFLGFDGPIKMCGANLELCIFEEYELRAPAPKMLYLGRRIAKGDRDAVFKYNLKKRSYISRTSMDAELSLVTANLTLAAPGKIIYDPFVGTGSFSVANAHFGAFALGSDIDGRSIRGSQSRNHQSNFLQYGLLSNFLDNFISDLTHTPLRQTRFLDGIICDPPYGVREGPKVLGHREGKEAQLVMIDGVPAHQREGYIAPKRPYGFDDMLHDVLDFSFNMLVDNGRVSMWMPTADDEEFELSIPTHPGLELKSVAVQHFNKWSRRLLTYRRLPDALVNGVRIDHERESAKGSRANDLNRFRKKGSKVQAEHRRRKASPKVGKPGYGQ